MTDPQPGTEPTITDEQLRAELERDPYLLHRLRADEERASEVAAKSLDLHSAYFKQVTAAIASGRKEILEPRKPDGTHDLRAKATDLAEARHILSAIATYKAIAEGATHLHRPPADPPAIAVKPR
jgi:hypothetical protein